MKSSVLPQRSLAVKGSVKSEGFRLGFPAMAYFMNRPALIVSTSCYTSHTAGTRTYGERLVKSL